jgi:3-oxoacyl-[acyl-carrier-protein] synthase-3
MHSRVKYIEYYLPKKIENAKILKKEIPSWNFKQSYNATGINKRYIADRETVMDMALISAKKLIKKNKINKKKIDFLILVTQSPDSNIPATSNILHNKLSLKKSCLCFDLNQGCSGFIYGLSVASALIESKISKSGIIICSEKYSQYIQKNDKTCRPIFSDGASSALIVSSKNNDIVGFDLGSDGSGYENLIVPLPGKNIKFKNKKLLKNKIFMDGAKVFMFTLSTVKSCFLNILKKSKILKKDIDYFVFHQASKKVLDNLSRKLDLDKNKVIKNYNLIGNTVSASIPIALKMAKKRKILKKNSKIMILGFGVGYSWGGCIIKF